MKTDNKKSKNLATPGKPMAEENFACLIKKTEEEEFISDEEFHNKF